MTSSRNGRSRTVRDDAGAHPREAHLVLRAAREQRRRDVTGADGDTRTTAEDGQQHTRVMIYGPVRTSRLAYRKRLVSAESR